MSIIDDTENRILIAKKELEETRESLNYDSSEIESVMIEQNNIRDLLIVIEELEEELEQHKQWEELFNS